MSASRIGNIVFARVLISGQRQENQIPANIFTLGGVMNKLKPCSIISVKLTASGSPTASYTGHLIINPDSGNVTVSITDPGKEYAVTFTYFTFDF